MLSTRTYTLLLVFVCAFVCHAHSVRECVVETYQSQIGVRELSGNNDGVAVEEYLKSTKLGKGHAWCAAFVNWCLECCNANRANSAWSPSWFNARRNIYDRTKGGNLKFPAPGDVFGIYFASKKRIAHVGFIHHWGDRYVLTVEGNTNEAGSREGDGVYQKRRVKKQIYQVANWID